jgi:hypothetical protein
VVSGGRPSGSVQGQSRCRSMDCTCRTFAHLRQVTSATDIPYIKGIPEIPGALPIVGHLLKLGEDHATSCEKWWKQ